MCVPSLLNNARTCFCCCCPTKIPTIFHFGGGFVSLQRNEWRKFQAPKGVVTPKGRRSHTATVFQDSLYIYGGYQDLKGSTSELWAFHFGKYCCCDCLAYHTVCITFLLAYWRKWYILIGKLLKTIPFLSVVKGIAFLKRKRWEGRSEVVAKKFLDW